ncbi:LysR family transcriptional regulator [Kineobactrum salinum]|uniref:LysR family transcriptional regulator n=1 Tax=Kineobactrum salinum TaxID=2708301 RepID=A0A6C0TZL2_9GAMM|nr:LysR family transcriptional regulator [Kineobactrum salinum]QIB64973.1 LysR family transcriptional regulator [Kineobactrum salinum]
MTEFDLKLLFVFQTLIQKRSVSQAADALNLSQPSVSRCLSSLRTHFGDELFVKTRGGMKPTPYAQEIAPAVDEMLSIYYSKLAQMQKFDPLTSKRTFKIAALDVGHAYFFPRLIPVLEKDAPHVSLKGVPLGLHSLIEELETGETDVAIGAFPKLYGGVYERTLYRDNYVCLVRKKHPNFKGKPSLEEFQQARHIIASTKGQGHIHELIEKELHKVVPKDNIRVVSHNFLSCVLIALHSDYVVTLPSRTCEASGQLANFRMFPHPVELPPFEVKEYWHERFHKDPANQWLRNTIADCVK